MTISIRSTSMGVLPVARKRKVSNVTKIKLSTQGSISQVRAHSMKSLSSHCRAL